MNGAVRACRWALAAGLCAGVAAVAQGPARAAASAPDEAVEAGTALVGRATILRGFLGGGELRYNGQGRVQGQPKVVDWTLAGVDVQKVSRRADGVIEMEGVRVAIRYNPDQHTFERHPQKESKVRIEVAGAAGEGAGVVALAAIFSVGIDPALQRSMPSYWRHYFTPGLDWEVDDLAGKPIVAANAKPTADLEFPLPVKKGEPEFTAAAAKDRVKGTVQLKIVVGVDGEVRRIAIRQPLGYGLDERTVEAVSKYRFQPATQKGVPVAVEMLVNQAFDVGAGPR